MQPPETDDARAQARREAVALLLDDPFVEQEDNLVLLNGILDNHATADTRLKMWEELVAADQFRNDLINGNADPGYDDEGRPEDREQLAEQLEEQVEALLTSIACVPHPVPAAEPLRRVA